MSYWADLRASKGGVLPVREIMERRRGRLAALVETVEYVLAHPVFFVALLATHLLWVVANLPWIPWWEPWDPYPFTFLATVASAEAPFIALLLLMRQRRDRRVGELRDEIDLQVTLHIERQTTEVLKMLDALRSHVGAPVADLDLEGLEEMKQRLDPQQLLEDTLKELEEAEPSGPEER